MMLFDSFVWGEILAESETGKTYRQRFPAAKKLLVSTLLLYKFSRWVSRTMTSQIADEVLITSLTGKVV